MGRVLFGGLVGAMIVGAAAALSVLAFLLCALVALLKDRRDERFGRVMLRMAGGPLAASAFSLSAFLWSIVAPDEQVKASCGALSLITVAIGLAAGVHFAKRFAGPGEVRQPPGHSRIDGT